MFQYLTFNIYLNLYIYLIYLLNFVIVIVFVFVYFDLITSNLYFTIIDIYSKNFFTLQYVISTSIHQHHKQHTSWPTCNTKPRYNSNCSNTKLTDRQPWHSNQHEHDHQENKLPTLPNQTLIIIITSLSPCWVAMGIRTVIQTEHTAHEMKTLPNGVNTFQQMTMLSIVHLCVGN